MKQKIDALNCAIISLLMEDGRMPSSEIARSIGGVSARTVANRIHKMSSVGLIHSGIVVHPKALGYSVLADVFIETAPGRVKEVAEAVAQLDRVSYVGYAMGDRDVSIQVVAMSVEDLHTFVTDTIHQIPGVARTRTFTLAAILKDIYHWRIPTEIRQMVESEATGDLERVIAVKRS